MSELELEMAEIRQQQGYLIIQSRTPRGIGELLRPSQRANQQPGDSVVLVVTGEATRQEYAEQKWANFSMGYDYFYRVEAAD